MLRNTHIARLALGSLVIALASSAVAAPKDEVVPDPPAPALWKGEGVTVDEKLGARVPSDARFRTQDGAVVTLGEVLRGELPTILTFNYSDCPMLCSLQLNGLMAVLPKVAEPGAAPEGAAKEGDVAFRIGTQFRIVTVSLEPKESLDRMIKMRERYLEKLPESQRESARRGWTFLAAATPGDAASIRRVASAVGFSYVYIADRAEWAHPAALIFLSTTGTVTRYVYGIEFEPAVVRESIFKAGIAEAATAVGFMNRCYHYDPDASDHSRAGVMALRVGAAGGVVLLIAGLGIMHVIGRSRRARSAQSSQSRDRSVGERVS